MVVKINISIPEELLEKLDEAAREAHSSRSAFITESLRQSLKEKEEQRLLEKRLHAADVIDRIREECGPWDGTAEILKWRDLH